MKLLQKLQASLPGKLLVLLLSFFLLSSTSINAQTGTPCRADFDFKIDHNTKTVVFEAKSNKKPVAFIWNFGDSTREKGDRVKHQYDEAGKYKVCVTAIAFNNSTNQRCTTQVCKEIKIVDCDRLEAKFAFEIEDKTIKVRGKANSNVVKAGYTFGDGTAKRGFENKHTYKKPGIYKVCLIVVDTVYGCKVEVCKRVIIGKDKCELEGDYRIIKDGLGIKVEGKANERGVHYFWSFGDGSDATGKQAKHKYKKAGTYEVCLIIFNPKTKCKVCVCKKVEVEKPCNLKADFQYKVDNNKIYVKARSNASKNSTYIWSFGDGTIKRGMRAAHVFNKRGVYEVKLVVIDKRRNCRTTVSKRVVIGKKASTTNGQFVIPENNTSNSNQVYNQPFIQPTWEATATPSPAVNNVSFSSETAQLALVEISDLNGTVVINQTGTLANIDVSSLKHGVYCAKLTAADGTVNTVRFVKY
jgi:PKD repeat protein